MLRSGSRVTGEPVMAMCLVTGGAGFIGSHLVDALVDAGHRVRVLDDLSNGVRENVHPGRGARRRVARRSARPSRRRVAGTELVFHLGALGAVSRSVADPLTTDRVNVHGTLAVADEGLPRRACGGCVFASSSSVYGGAEVIPTPESTPLAPPLAVRGEQAGRRVVRPRASRTSSRSRPWRCATSTSSGPGSGRTRPTPR